MLKFSLFVFDRFTFFIIPLEKRQDAVDVLPKIQRY